jgi:hypothetical protein
VIAEQYFFKAALAKRARRNAPKNATTSDDSGMAASPQCSSGNGHKLSERLKKVQISFFSCSNP